MRYLLDTCVLSEALKPSPQKSVVDWVAATDDGKLFLSVLTLGEIEKGIAKLKPSKKRDVLVRWAENELREHFSRRTLPIDADVAMRWGQLAGAADAAGEPLPVIDSLLAATALVHNLVVVTRNVRHIERAKVRIHNPWAS